MKRVKGKQITPRKKQPKVKRSRPSSGSEITFRNSYEAAKAGRRMRLWRPGSPGPNVSMLGDLTELRNRSRDSLRNNPWVSRGISSWVSNEVGSRMTFKSMATDQEFRKRADDLWNQQSSHFDADHLMDLNGMISSIVKTRRVAGEIFIRRRIRNLSDGLPVPLQYQLLEPEFCPHTQNQVLGGGRTIRAGIEFDGIGRRRAYWMYRSHPGDNFGVQFSNLKLVPVPASSIIHHYKPERPGQIRGVPAIVRALIKAKDFDEYDGAELVRKKDKSVHTGAITRAPLDLDNDPLFDPLTGEPISKDTAGVPVTDMEPGTMFSLLPGEDVKMFDGDNTGSGYADFVRQALMGVAVGQDVPYEFLSGDFSKLNDRTLRVVLAEYHRTVEQDRWQITIPQVCYTIWADFIDLAVLSGALDAPGFDSLRSDFIKVACHPEGWPYLHALQDASAAVLRLNNGLTSRKRLAAERGEDIGDIDQENSEDQKRAEDLGLNYAGQTPSPDVPPPPEDDPPNADNPT